MNQSCSTIDDTIDIDLQLVSPRFRGWVHEHYALVTVCGATKRVCRYEGCNKSYAAKSSHQVFKKHWLEHTAEMNLKKTRFLFADELHINRLIKMVIDLHLDYTTVEKQSFRLFSESLNPNKRIICRRTLSDIIMAKASYLSTLVTEKLSKCSSIALTFDIWSPRKGARGFGCVTAHYITLEGKSENLVLNFRRMKFPHDADTICKFLYKTVLNHKLEGRVVAITTDNASNNLAGIRKLANAVNLSPLSLGFVHYKCMAHIIDLGVRAAMKNLKPAVNSVRSAILAIKSSTKRKEAFRNIQERLIAEADQHTNQALELIEDIDHRWNSTLLMLERAHSLSAAIDELLNVTPELMGLGPIDWPLLEDLIEFLKPFYEASKRLCVEKDCSISVVSFVTPKLIEHCIKHESGSNLIIKSAAESLGSKLNSYRSEVYHPIVNIAHVLDPRYKMKGFQDDECNTVRDELSSLIESVPEQNHSACTPSSSQTTNMFCDDSENEEENVDELEAYLATRRINMKENAFSYWKVASMQYPKLASIAQKILCIQATSVASERVFSMAGNVDTLCRNRLLDQSVESIVLSKSWMKFLDLE